MCSDTGTVDSCRCVGLKTLRPVLIVPKSGSLNLLKPSAPVQACNGTALPLLSSRVHARRRIVLTHKQFLCCSRKEMGEHKLEEVFWKHVNVLHFHGQWVRWQHQSILVWNLQDVMWWVSRRSGVITTETHPSTSPRCVQQCHNEHLRLICGKKDPAAQKITTKAQARVSEAIFLRTSLFLQLSHHIPLYPEKAIYFKSRVYLFILLICGLINRFQWASKKNEAGNCGKLFNCGNGFTIHLQCVK